MSGKSFRGSAYLLGFSLGGFFDGILLHQILQWHHLLLGIRTGPLADLRAQIVADGIFHGLMYVVAAVGLWLLFKAREHMVRVSAPRSFLAAFLVGFGAWHVADALLSHWLTGIHRIRMDVENPLVWDVLWLVVFGLVPLAIGVVMRRGSGDPGGDGAKVAAGLPMILVAATLVAGVVAARPAPAGEATVTVVLRPGVAPSRLLLALARTDARIVWSDSGGAVWVLRPGEQTSLASLYAEGALYVSATALPGGCSQWLRL
jgi:uncharacterized membrane protein